LPIGMSMTRRDVRITEGVFACVGVVGLLILSSIVPSPWWAGLLMAVGGALTVAEAEWLWRSGRLSHGSRP
jgi:hypothetical protein